MPWPSSHLPVNTVTVPLALMRTQPSSMRLVLRLPGRLGRAACCASTDGMLQLKPTVMAPAVLRKLRRAVEVFMSCLPRSTLDRAHDAVVGSAAAEVGRQCFPDLCFGRFRRLIQQRLGGHDHAVRAVAALRCL